MKSTEFADSPPTWSCIHWTHFNRSRGNDLSFRHSNMSYVTVLRIAPPAGL